MNKGNFGEKMREFQSEKRDPTNPEQRFRRTPNSRKLAIEAFCFKCMGGPENEGVRSLIRGCTATDCALHNFRPYK